MSKTGIKIADLMALAAASSGDPSEHLAQVYTWKHERTALAAKAFAGVGTALALTPLLPIMQPSTVAIQWGWVAATWIAAAVLILIGAGIFLAGMRIHAEYLNAQRLLAEFVEVQPFLRLYFRSR
jgi:hypothetical protein